jgi:hypothetical protein
MKASVRKYKSFREFYPHYLTEHSQPANRVLHFTGTLLVIVITTLIVIRPEWWLLFLIPVAGYGFAWTGHFVFEKNRPATFTYPLWSLAADFVMFFHICTFQIGKKLKHAQKEMKINAT